jgi:hypothetical protein
MKRLPVALNRRVGVIAAAGALGAIAIANPLLALPKGTEDYNKNGATVTTPCDNPALSALNDSISYAAPPALWPPNHKYYEDIVVTANGQQADQIVLTTTGTYNQYEGDVEQNGSGNTGDDVRPADGVFNSEDDEDQDGNVEFIATQNGTGSAAETWWARAERSGHKSTIDTQGREYTFTYQATFNGVQCYTGGPKTFTVIVPHDMRTSNR